MKSVPLFLAAVAVLTFPRAARAERCTGDLPVLFVIQDWSGSMAGAPDGTVPECQGTNPPVSECPRKYTIARTVLPDVLDRFASDFRYAFMMYPAPGDVSCSTGSILEPIPADPLDIYNDLTVNPAGRTPTALSLDAARAYLNSLSLPSSVPANVLLVTDGMPNCNGWLDPTTCECDDNRTGGTSYCNTNQDANRCLDSTRTRDSAAALAAAGFNVYVLGFGTAATADNNLAVLNGVAQAGNTGTAYSANDAASLNASLESIIASARQCCTDACLPGQDSCSLSGNSSTQCVLGVEGCYVLETQACPSGTVCSAGSCSSCQQCSVGSQRCGGNGQLETCTAGANGCSSWTSQSCPAGSVCSGGQCNACASECTAGARQCSGNGEQVCISDSNGCTTWGTVSPCGAGTLCNPANGQCELCLGCFTNGRQCVDATTARVCVRDANGCTSWQEETCPNGQTCSGGSCSSCNGCNAGETRCAGNVVQTCTQDGNGCTAWTDTSTCSEGQLCSAGACGACPSSCAPGSRRCDVNDVQQCVTDALGCSDWQSLGVCSHDQLCVDGACCANACELGSVRCSADGTSIESCVRVASGCADWTASQACASGTQCVDETCLQSCSLSAEFDECPAGTECTPTMSGNFCVPVNTGSSSSSSTGGSVSSGTGSSSSSSSTSSSSSSGMVVSRDGGSGAGLGGGGEEDDETTTGSCGCETSKGSEPAAGWLVLGFVGLVVVRGRRRSR